MENWLTMNPGMWDHGIVNHSQQTTWNHWWWWWWWWWWTYGIRARSWTRLAFKELGPFPRLPKWGSCTNYFQNLCNASLLEKVKLPMGRRRGGWWNAITTLNYGTKMELNMCGCATTFTIYLWEGGEGRGGEMLTMTPFKFFHENGFKYFCWSCA